MLQRKLSRFEASKSFMRSLVAFIEEEEVSASERKKEGGQKKKKKKKGDDGSPEDPMSASSSMPKAESRRQSPDQSFQDLPSQEPSPPPSWTLDSQLPPSAATIQPGSEAGIRAHKELQIYWQSMRTMSQQHQTEEGTTTTSNIHNLVIPPPRQLKVQKISLSGFCTQVRKSPRQIFLTSDIKRTRGFWVRRCTV